MPASAIGVSRTRALAVLLEQPFRHLVGAAALGDAFADDEDFAVARHLLIDSLAQGLAVHHLSCRHGASSRSQ